MSDDAGSMGTKPVAEHGWMQQFLGDWTFETTWPEQPDMPAGTATGIEHVRDLGGLWAIGEGDTDFGNGSGNHHIWGIGFDVSVKEYRSFWVMSMSSHLWKGVGELSDDGKKMTLSTVGPNMVDEGTANYRDVIEIIDADHRR